MKIFWYSDPCWQETVLFIWTSALVPCCQFNSHTFSYNHGIICPRWVRCVCVCVFCNSFWRPSEYMPKKIFNFTMQFKHLEDKNKNLIVDIICASFNIQPFSSLLFSLQSTLRWLWSTQLPWHSWMCARCVDHTSVRTAQHTALHGVYTYRLLQVTL